MTTVADILRSKSSDAIFSVTPSDTMLTAIQRMAEMLMRRQRGDDAPDQDTVTFWPGLTRRGTRIVRDALMEYETVIDADVSELFRLRSVFNNQAPE